MVELCTRQSNIIGEGGIYSEKLRLRGFCVWCNLRCGIWQVPVQIRQEITTPWGLPNPISQVLHLVSDSCFNPASHSHLYHASLSLSSTTVQSLLEHKVQSPVFICPYHHEFTLSAPYTEYKVHCIQHTPQIICHRFILRTFSWPLHESSASSLPPQWSAANTQFTFYAAKVKWQCHCGDGFQCGHHMGWFRVERGGAACT
jgi:hypothetical protein